MHYFVKTIQMRIHAEAIITPQEDFTVPVDKKGLVIYFSVNGKRFLFNGHSGFFADSLPEWTEQAFTALAQPEKQRNKIFKSLTKLHGSVFENLIREIELFQNETHPDLEPETKQNRFLHRMSPQSISVYLSQGCNLACSYCFNQGGSAGRQPSFMSVETARQALDFITNIVKSEAHEFITVFLFGGEPLLNPRAAYILSRGLQDLNHRETGSKVHLILSTNGTIYNQDLFDIYAESPDNSRVAVSLDAFKEVHDKNRPFTDKKKGSSYDCVVDNLKRLIKANIPHSVSCMAPYPYDFVGVSEELHRLPIERLEIKQLNHCILGRPALPEVFKRDFDTWRRNYIAYSDYYIEYLNSSNPVKHIDRWNLLGHYARRLAKPEGPSSTLACQLADAVLAIDAAGRLIPCETFL
ncbi:MAG: radical SAM protein, partial [Deltaproteobacteria bacterium]|nr:radical SAM protein [Deltaproteobacteria bacterium]MBW2323189.1 radical SAM protein [Deltaproteobacteria bacterium]